MAIETELKLTLAEKDVDAFKLLLEREDAVASSQRLLSIYFDTPALTLARRDVALRLRKVKGRWVQTLKQSEQAGGGLFRRVELEVPVAGQTLELDRIDDDELRGFLLQPEIASTLGPLFTTDIRRTLWTLRAADGTTVEVALDQGVISTGAAAANAVSTGKRARRGAPDDTASKKAAMKSSANFASEAICEVEIELLEGNSAALFDLARRWSQSIALRPETMSKAARGFRLHEHAAPAKPATAQSPRLQPDMSPHEAFAAVVQEALRHFLENIGGITGDHDSGGVLGTDDAEYVHQARVALRRLRSALQAFATLDLPVDHDALTGELQWLAKALGDVRDLDVLLESTLPPIVAATEDDSGLLRLRDQLGRQRDDQRNQARMALRSPRCGTLLITLLGTIHQEQLTGEQRVDTRNSLVSFARQTLRVHRRKVIRLLRDWDRLDAEARHGLRKRAKRLRYTLEFFSTLLEPKAVKRYLKQLKTLQQLLGDMNDAAMSRAIMTDVAARHPALAYSAGMVTGWTARQASQCQAQLEPNLEKLRTKLKRL